MGPKAAGLSRSRGGAVWSPWPWPLSAQAGPHLRPLPYTRFPSWESTDASASNRPAPPSRPPVFLRLTAQEKGEAGQGVSYINYLAAGGTYTLDSRVCV